MKVATWNVNGIRAREAQVLDLIARERPDVLCLQEIKAPKDKVPASLGALDGYGCLWHGETAYSGVALLADAPTGVRLGALSSGGLAAFYLTYVTSTVADTAVQSTITRGATTAYFMQEVPDPAPGPGRLVVGGTPSTRSLIRFALPDVIRDSATIVRAWLDLVPSEPLRGLPNDPAELTATGIIIDVGAKSPLLLGLVEVDTVEAGQTDLIRIEIRRIVSQWQVPVSRPAAVFLAIEPEAATFALPLIVSTADPARAPRLRIAYVRRYPFVNP